MLSDPKLAYRKLSGPIFPKNLQKNENKNAKNGTNGAQIRAQRTQISL